MYVWILMKVDDWGPSTVIAAFRSLEEAQSYVDGIALQKELFVDREVDESELGADVADAFYLDGFFHQIVFTKIIE